MKVIWTSDVTSDFVNLSHEEKLDELRDLGYDNEMLDGLSDEELNDIIYSDETLVDLNIEDFEYSIAPEIAKQVRDGEVVLIGKQGRWFGDVPSSAVIPAESLLGVSRDIEDIEIVDDNGQLYWVGKHHDGTNVYGLYGFSNDDEEFKAQLEALGAIENYNGWYGPMSDDEAFDNLSVDSIENIMEYAEGENGASVLTPVRNTITTTESLVEASTKDSTGLGRELEEIKELSEEYGREYFTSMPFTSFDNDEMSIEYQYPNFFKIVKSFFKEMGVLQGDELEDADVLDTQWDTDISQHDWEVILRTCEKLVNKPGSTVQIEKEYKTGYNSPISDEEILADREVTEFEEDLRVVPPYEYIFVGDRYNGFLSANDWGMTEEEFKSEVLDYEGKHCYITSVELEVDDDFEDNYYNIKFGDGHELRGVSGTHLMRPVMENLTEDFVDIKYFRLSELNSMIDKVVVFNKKVIYSNLDNYESDDEKPDFDKLGFEIQKDGDVVIPEGYTAVIKGVSSAEGYNPELYLESNGEGFEIALGWVEFGEISIIDPSLEGSLNEALDPGHDYHCEDEDKAKLLVKMYFENEIKELSDLHDKLEPLFASKKDAVEWLYDYTRVEESLNESFFGYDVISFDDKGDSVSLAPWDEIDQYGHPDQKLFTTADEAIEYAKNIDDKNCSVIKVEYIINSNGDREIITPSHKDAEIIWQKSSLNEDLKIITDFSEYSPWSGAVDTYNKIEEAGLLGDLESALEDIYPEGIDQTSLNDLLWFEPEYVLSLVGLESEDEDFDESLVEEDTETWPWGDPNYTGKQKIEA